MFEQYKGLRRELYVLFIGRIMTNLGSMIWPMLTLILNKKIGLNASQVASCLLVFSLISLPVSLLGGKLTDRLNKRNIIVVCDSVSVICFLICGFIPISMTSVILFAVAGLFQTVEWPAYDALIADFTLPSDRQRAYSLSYLGANLGLVLSPTIGGLLFNDYLNVAFIINGLAIFLSTCLIFFLIKDVSREESEEDINEYENELDNDTNALGYIFGSRVLVVYLIALTLYQIVYSPYSFLMPLEMGNAYGDQGSVLFGTLNSVNCLTVVLLTGFLTRVLSRVMETGKLLIGISSVLAGLIIFRVFLNHPAAIYIAIIIFTVGEIVTVLGSSPFISKRIPSNYRGRITSIMNVFTNVAISLFTKVFGFVYDRNGSLSAWILAYVIGILGIIAILYLKVIDRKDYPALYK
ncbi:MAG: MFS transporter [Erysipelotrichaceae bacterium]|nr:MFS transporter [Erysipelotrichaceae bacterium]